MAQTQLTVATDLGWLVFYRRGFVMYFFYGLVIIRFFQIIQTLISVRLTIYQVLAMVAIILGILNLKDFIKPKRGGFLTEIGMVLK